MESNQSLRLKTCSRILIQKGKRPDRNREQLGMTTAEDIQTAVREQLPFAIHMNNGREYVVRNSREIHTVTGIGHAVYVSDDRLVPSVLALENISSITH